MKNVVWSIKLGAALGLLVASAALAAPNQNEKKDSPNKIGNSLDADVGGPTAEIGETTPTLNLPPRTQGFAAGELTENDPAPKYVSPPALLNDVVPTRVKLPKYWIGVKCRGPLPESLRSQVDAPVKQGVIVLEVVDGSPAAKAGLQPHDILLVAGTRPLANALDLIQVVEEAENKAISIALIRKGKHQKIEVTPEKSPWRKPKDKATTETPAYPELDKLVRWLEQNHPRGSQQQMRLRFMHPGIILPPDALIHPTLPGSMSVTIMKEGNKPTQITVKRGDDVWKVDEKGIDKLPKDVQPYVHRMLSGMVIGPELLGPQLEYLPDWTIPGSPAGKARLPSARDRLEERMDRINERLEELHDMIRQLHEKAGPEEEK
ncbi:MAG: PDZ domain-containing protein [Pirellulales bacterium]|nr:PDZ domain-containing protein [Pirellulales bacterium]